MQSYYTSGSNLITIRVKDNTSNSYTMSYEDMYLLTTTTQSFNNFTYNNEEGLLGFTASISGAIYGSEYRATLFDDSNNVVWNGTFNTFASSSTTESKAIYETQIPPDFKSNVTDNSFIIL
jgi:hypothetical protein